MACPICGFTGAIFFNDTVQKYQYFIKDKFDYVDCSLEYCSKCDHIHNYSFKEEWLDEIYNNQPTPSVPVSNAMMTRTDYVLEWIGYDFYNKKNIMEIPAPTGRVTTQDRNILLTTVRLSAPIPRASPTPNTAPTSVCVVDTGMPVPEATTTVVAAANSAAKPRLGVSSVIFLPMVAITL